MEKLMSIFEDFDFEKIGEMLPRAESMMSGLSGWMALLVLVGPLLLIGFGLYYLFFAPKEANHAMGYRFFYAMSRVEVWQHAQRLAGIVYVALGGVLFLIMGLFSLSFGALATPDMVWRAMKCMIWELVLVIIATLAMNILLMVLYDFKGNPRKPSAKNAQSKKPTTKRTPRYATQSRSPRSSTPSQRPCSSAPTPSPRRQPPTGTREQP